MQLIANQQAAVAAAAASGSGNDSSNGSEQQLAKLQVAREHLGVAMRNAETEQSLRLDAEEFAAREAALRKEAEAKAAAAMEAITNLER